MGRFLLLALVLVGLGESGCGTAPTVGKVLYEGPQGTVYLQHIPDRSFQASHPVTLESDLLYKILTGLQIQDQERVLQNLLAGPSSPISVFSEDQIRFLAPLLAEGLRTATADQRVGYRLRTSALGSVSVETTAGSLYASSGALYVSLSQYRYVPNRTNLEDNAHRRLPDTSGLTNRTLLFTPHTALLPDSSPLPGTGLSGERFVAIDPRLLRELPPPAGASNQTATQVVPLAKQVPAPQPVIRSSGSPAVAAGLLEARDEEIRSLKDLVIKKDLELDALKSELQSIKRQLDNRAATPQDNSARKNKRPQTP